MMTAGLECHVHGGPFGDAGSDTGARPDGRGRGIDRPGHCGGAIHVFNIRVIAYCSKGCVGADRHGGGGRRNCNGNELAVSDGHALCICRGSTGHVGIGSGNRDRISQVKQRCEEILSRDGLQFADWREAQWTVWQIMNSYALPPHRTENTLMAGYNQLLKIREKAQRLLKAGNQHDLCHCLEVLNLLDVAEVVLLAVNERKESRGPARRQDYPFTNPLLGKFLVITQQDGKPAFKWEKPRRVSE